MKHAFLVSRYPSTEYSFEFSLSEQGKEPHTVYFWMSLEDEGEGCLIPELRFNRMKMLYDAYEAPRIRFFNSIPKWFYKTYKKTKFGSRNHFDGPDNDLWFLTEYDNARFEWMNVDGYPHEPDIGDWARFAIEHGIAPGQSFLVRASAMYTCDYYGECDSSFYWDIVSISQIHPDDALGRWERFLQSQETASEREAESSGVEERGDRSPDKAGMETVHAKVPVGLLFEWE